MRKANVLAAWPLLALGSRYCYWMGEILFLRWQDVDLEHGRLAVSPSTVVGGLLCLRGSMDYKLAIIAKFLE